MSGGRGGLRCGGSELLGFEGIDCRFAVRWKQDHEGGAKSVTAPDVDPAASLGDDSLRDREAQSGSLLLGGLMVSIPALLMAPPSRALFPENVLSMIVAVDPPPRL